MKFGQPLRPENDALDILGILSHFFVHFDGFQITYLWIGNMKSSRNVDFPKL